MSYVGRVPSKQLVKTNKAVAENGHYWLKIAYFEVSFTKKKSI